MTDKQSNKQTPTPTEKPIVANEDHIANEDFRLNHFEQNSEAESDAVETSDNIESFYTDNLFTESEQTEQAAAAEKADPFAQPGYAKKEPIIPPVAEPATEANMNTSEPVPDQQQSTPEIDMEQPITAAPVPDIPLSEPPAEQHSGTKPITVFAILAMLVAAIAVWLNPGASTSSDSVESTALKPLPVLAADVQMQRLETRISSLEQRSSQQNEALHKQIERLQQQLSTLTSQLTKQAAKRAKKQQPTRPAATKRNTPIQHPSTATLKPIQHTGWVVNLASVESKHAAIKAQGRYKAHGIASEIYAAVIKGKTWYRLRIGGFASKQEAIAQKRYLAKKHGIKDAWVQKP